MSTTLSTNSTLEGKGHPAGLILAGYTVSGEVPAQHMISIDGRHDSKGNEINCFDLKSVEEFVNSTRGRLFSYAGAYEWAVTAFLNARLIPTTSQFIRAVLSVMGINIRSFPDGHEMFSEVERKIADNYLEAVDYGLGLMEKLIFDHMGGYGLQKDQVRYHSLL